MGVQPALRFETSEVSRVLETSEVSLLETSEVSIFSDPDPDSDSDPDPDSDSDPDSDEAIWKPSEVLERPPRFRKDLRGFGNLGGLYIRANVQVGGG